MNIIIDDIEFWFYAVASDRKCFRTGIIKQKLLFVQLAAIVGCCGKKNVSGKTGRTDGIGERRNAPSRKKAGGS
jgi:hypothetical protein